MRRLTEKNRLILTLIVNGVILLSVAIIAAIGMCQGAGEGQVGSAVIGLGYLKPYTMDSNLLAGISSLIIVICTVRNLVAGKDTTPNWAVTFSLMASACLLLTMVVAACFLAPMRVMMGQSYFSMFSGDMFFFHFLNPILSAFSFTVLLRTRCYCRRDCLWGMIPTIIYSFVYLAMVVFLHRWEDFYNFTFGGRYQFVPLVFLVIYALVLLMSLFLVYFHNRTVKTAE